MLMTGGIRSSNLLRSQLCTALNVQRGFRASSKSIGISTSLSPAVVRTRLSLLRIPILHQQPLKRQCRLNSTNEPLKSTDAKVTTTTSNNSSGSSQQSSPPSTSTSTTTQTTTTSTTGSTESMTMFQRFLAPKPMPERHTFAWYREILLICTVFAITGSTTMVVVRPAVSEGLGIKGNFIDGPWSYRICSLVIMTPLYATMLVGVGTIFGRHAYFRHFSVKIFSRFGIPPELMDPTFHETKHTFRKW